jgi:PAS domain S-box-containing protein
MYDGEGKKKIYDVVGEVIRDEATGEFFGGVVTCREVINYADMIDQFKEHDEERFRLICNTMPQLVWTATPDGLIDFYNTRWYEYTGLPRGEGLGNGWKQAFHPDDLPEAEKRWALSIETGRPYTVEYRCRSAAGEWRWFIGRALPLRNRSSDNIDKWFGMVSSVHDYMQRLMVFARYLH